MNTCLRIHFNCGCGFNTQCIFDAIEHAKITGHTVNIFGSLTYSKFSTLHTILKQEEYLDFINVKFSCGDGFNTTSLKKAEQHVVKTRHQVSLRGWIRFAEGKSPALYPARSAGRSHSTESGGRGPTLAMEVDASNDNSVA